MAEVIALASDHGGLDLKNALIEKLKKVWIWEQIRTIPWIIPIMRR